MQSRVLIIIFNNKNEFPFKAYFFSRVHKYLQFNYEILSHNFTFYKVT